MLIHYHAEQLLRAAGINPALLIMILAVIAVIATCVRVASSR